MNRTLLAPLPAQPLGAPRRRAGGPWPMLALALIAVLLATGAGAAPLARSVKANGTVIVRAEADLEGPVLAIVSRGEPLRVEEGAGPWLRVATVSGASGHAAGRLEDGGFSPDESLAPPPFAPAPFLSLPLGGPILAAPAAGSRHAGALPAGAIVRAFERHGLWVLISSTDNQSGWIPLGGVAIARASEADFDAAAAAVEAAKEAEDVRPAGPPRHDAATDPESVAERQAYRQAAAAKRAAETEAREAEEAAKAKAATDKRAAEAAAREAERRAAADKKAADEKAARDAAEKKAADDKAARDAAAEKAAEEKAAKDAAAKKAAEEKVAAAEKAAEEKAAKDAAAKKAADEKAAKDAAEKEAADERAAKAAAAKKAADEKAAKDAAEKSDAGKSGADDKAAKDAAAAAAAEKKAADEAARAAEKKAAADKKAAEEAARAAEKKAAADKKAAEDAARAAEKKAAEDEKRSGTAEPAEQEPAEPATPADDTSAEDRAAAAERRAAEKQAAAEKRAADEAARAAEKQAAADKKAAEEAARAAEKEAREARAAAEREEAERRIREAAEAPKGPVTPVEIPPAVIVPGADLSAKPKHDSPKKNPHVSPLTSGDAPPIEAVAEHRAGTTPVSAAPVPAGFEPYDPAAQLERSVGSLHEDTSALELSTEGRQAPSAERPAYIDSSGTPLNTSVVSQIVARVNDEILTNADFERKVADQFEELRRADPARAAQTSPDAVRRRVLQRSIEQMLLLDQARIMGMQMDRVYQQAKERFMKQAGIKDDMELLQLLDASGRTWDDFRRELLWEAVPPAILKREVFDKLTVSEDEISSHYRLHQEEWAEPACVRLREIVLQPEAKETTRDFNQRLDRVLDRLDAGEDFCAVARSASAAASRESCGLLPDCFTAGQLDERVAQVAFRMKPGDIEPVTTDWGYHVVRLEESRPRRQRALSEVRDDVMEKLRVERANEDVRRYLDLLREGASVEIAPEYGRLLERAPAGGTGQ